MAAGPKIARQHIQSTKQKPTKMGTSKAQPTQFATSDKNDSAISQILNTTLKQDAVPLDKVHPVLKHGIKKRNIVVGAVNASRTKLKANVSRSEAARSQRLHFTPPHPVTAGKASVNTQTSLPLSRRHPTFTPIRQLSNPRPPPKPKLKRDYRTSVRQQKTLSTSSS